MLLLCHMATEQRSSFQDATVTVMGLGKYEDGSGFVTATWLMKHGAQIVVTDLKSERDLQRVVAKLMDWYRAYREAHPEEVVYQPVFSLGEHREEDFVNVQYVVQNPGVPSEASLVQAARQAGVSLESDASIFLREYPHATIAVTGTRGKTVVTTMLGEMLKHLHPRAIVAGNVKTSPLSCLDDLLSSQEEIPVVLEFSTWMLLSSEDALKKLGRGPDIGVLTNISKEHQDRYPDYAAYKKSKEILFRYQQPHQLAVLAKDEPEVVEVTREIPSEKVWFSARSMGEDGVFVEHGMMRYRRHGVLLDILPVEDIALKGDEALAHALAATCAALLRGVSISGIIDVLRTFVGEAGSREVVREVDEITYINDAAAQDVSALCETIKAFGEDRRMVLIAGGAQTSSELESLIPLIVAHVKSLILLPGEGSETLERAVLGKVPFEHALSMREAVRYARSRAIRGDAVLFSPGCTPSRLFSDAFTSGEAFREEVRTL